MRKFIRAVEPIVCTANSAKLNAQWQRIRTANPGAKFSWYVVEGKPVRDHILPALREQTQDHCSFCDAYPVAGVSEETVEHFRPKSMFPEHAYTWSNLYYCCNACQKKGEQWDDLLINPDAEDYKFSRYFEYDFTTGAIRPNPLAADEDQKRADVTLRLYQLDTQSRRRNRLEELWKFAHSQAKENPEVRWAYRNFLTPD